MTNTTAAPAKPKAEKRPYVVVKDGKTHLVNATSPVAAIIHVYKPTCRAAKASEMPALLTSGVQFEEA